MPVATTRLVSVGIAEESSHLADAFAWKRANPEADRALVLWAKEDVANSTTTGAGGVGVGVASAVLALCFPERFALIDFRVWRQLFGTDKEMFELTECRRYLGRLRKLADELAALYPGSDWPVQLVDYFAGKHDAAASRAG